MRGDNFFDKRIPVNVLKKLNSLVEGWINKKFLKKINIIIKVKFITIRLLLISLLFLLNVK